MRAAFAAAASTSSAISAACPTRACSIAWSSGSRRSAGMSTCISTPSTSRLCRDAGAVPVNYTIDHMGRVRAADGLDQLPFRTLIELMQRDEKCWVKVCGCERVSSAGPPFTDAVPFARRIVETAPDRVIWGTDWPHPNVKVMPNDGDLVDLIPLFAPEPELQQKILVTNPARLFEFETRTTRFCVYSPTTTREVLSHAENRSGLSPRIPAISSGAPAARSRCTPSAAIASRSSACPLASAARASSPGRKLA